MDEKEQQAQVLKFIGQALRDDWTKLVNTPPSRPILLQVLHLIRMEQERRGDDALPWDALPDNLRQLLDRLKAGECS